MKKTSLNDIANQLGVSKTLVSFVLNGKSREYRINEELAEKVMALAKKLNYQPNSIAQGLRTGKTRTIGLIIADIANPFFGKLGREIEQEAAKHGYRVVFCSSDENPEKSELQIRMLQQSLVDGYIISPPMNSEEQIKKLIKSKIPLVLIDRYFPQIDSNYIVVDNLEASYNATNHLIAKGRKRIALVTNNLQLANMIDRQEGYRKALIDSGLGIHEELIKILPFSHDNTDVAQAIKELTLCEAGKKADAILFSTSKMGIMGLEYISELGLNIPRDIAVVSFDNPDAYKICVSPVTAIDHPLKEIGKLAVEILVNEITAPKSKKQHVKLKTEFIIRRSCGS